MIQSLDPRLPARGNRVSSVLETRNRLNVLPAQSRPNSAGNTTRQSLAKETTKELRTWLPISRFADEEAPRGIEQVMRIASASDSQVMAWHQELHEYVDATCFGAIEFGGDGTAHRFRDSLTTELKDQLREETRFPIPSRSFVDFIFADRDGSLTLTKTEQGFWEVCLQVANDLFRLLDPLQQQRLVGAVNYGASTCRFTYFRRVAILDKSETRQEDGYSIDPEFESVSRGVFAVIADHQQLKGVRVD